MSLVTSAKIGTEIFFSSYFGLILLATINFLEEILPLQCKRMIKNQSIRSSKVSICARQLERSG